MVGVCDSPKEVRPYMLELHTTTQRREKVDVIARGTLGRRNRILGGPGSELHSGRELSRRTARLGPPGPLRVGWPAEGPDSGKVSSPWRCFEWRDRGPARGRRRLRRYRDSLVAAPAVLMEALIWDFLSRVISRATRQLSARWGLRFRSTIGHMGR